MAFEQDLSRRIKQLFRQPLDELTQQLPEPRSQKVRERVTQNRRTKGKAEPVHPFKIIVESEDYSLKYRPNNRGPDKDLSSSPGYGFVALENLGPGLSDRAIAADVYSGQSTTNLYDFKGEEFSAAIPTDASLSYLGYGFSATRGRFTKVSASYQSPYTFTNSNPGASTNHVEGIGGGLFDISASGCINIPNYKCDPNQTRYIAEGTFPKAHCGKRRAATGARVVVSTPSGVEPVAISETRNYVFGSSENLISSSGQYHYFKDKSVSGGSYAPVTVEGTGGDASFTGPSSVLSYGTTDGYSYKTRAKNYFLNKDSLSEHQGTYERSKTDDSTGGSSSKVGSSLAVSMVEVQFEYTGVLVDACGTGFIPSSTSYSPSSTTTVPSNKIFRYSESGSVDVQLSPSLTLPYTESKLDIISGPEGGAYTQNSSSASKNQSHSIAVYNYKGVEACFYSVSTSSSSSSLNTTPTSESNNQYRLWVNGIIYEISDSLVGGTYENNQYEPGLYDLTRDNYTTWVMFNSPQRNKIGTFYKAEPIWRDDDSVSEARVIVYDLIASGGISLVRRDKEPKYKLKIKPGEYPYAIKFYPQAGTIR